MTAGRESSPTDKPGPDYVRETIEALERMLEMHHEPWRPMSHTDSREAWVAVLEALRSAPSAERAPVDPGSEAANPVWDLVVEACLKAWPGKDKAFWSQSPLELITDIINERDEARLERDQQTRFKYAANERADKAEASPSSVADTVPAIPIAWHVVDKNGNPKKWMHPHYMDPATHANPDHDLNVADYNDVDGFPHRWETLYRLPPGVEAVAPASATPPFKPTHRHAEGGLYEVIGAVKVHMGPDTWLDAVHYRNAEGMQFVRIKPDFNARFVAATEGAAKHG